MARTVVVLLLVGAAVGAHAARGASAAHLRATREYEPKRLTVPAAALRPLSLGYRSALADLLWMRALLYFGEELEHAGATDQAMAYATAMSTLDPEFRAPYRWIGVAGLYRPVAVEVEDVERVVAYQRRWLERHPDDGKMLWEVGANLRFELLPLLRRRGASQQEMAEIERESADLILRAAAAGAAPAYVIAASAASLESLGERERAIQRLAELFPLVDDEATRASIQEQLAVLQAEQSVEAADAALRALESRRAQERPWLPLDFFVLTVEPTPPPIDSEADGEL